MKEKYFARIWFRIVFIVIYKNSDKNSDFSLRNTSETRILYVDERIFFRCRQQSRILKLTMGFRTIQLLNGQPLWQQVVSIHQINGNAVCVVSLDTTREHVRKKYSKVCSSTTTFFSLTNRLDTHPIPLLLLFFLCRVVNC